MGQSDRETAGKDEGHDSRRALGVNWMWGGRLLTLADRRVLERVSGLALQPGLVLQEVVLQPER